MRERGLKFAIRYRAVSRFCVAPRAGAWIEINIAGALRGLFQQSLPVRERGLKYLADESYTGAGGRSPCGSVD